MRSSLNPFSRLRRSVGTIATTLLLFFGVAQAVAAWHVTRGADQDRTTVSAADLPTPPAGGHVDDGCALCSTAVQPTFPVVLTLVAVESAPRLLLPRDGFLLSSSSHIELGASGPRAPPVVS
ncbi:MAG: hypothetical protein ACYC2K_09200 [Gemmatimonadales bacterium]